MFTATLPKLRLDALMVSVGVAASNFRENVFEVLPAVAVNFAVCAELTEATDALKLALDEPVATVTDEGTETDALLLARLTATPAEVTVPLSVTVHASVADPVTDPLLQVSALNVGAFVCAPNKATGRQQDNRMRSVARQMWN